MLKYGLNPKDKEQLEIPKFQYTGFGRGDGDYIHIYAYTADDPLTDENDVLVADEIFPVSNVDFFDEKTMDIDVGGHLRQMGLEDGIFKVKYLFLRRVAGKNQTVLVNDEGQVHVGQVQTKLINGETRYYSTKKFGKRQSRQELKEVFPKELKYVLTQISSDRTEVEVKIQNINNRIYAKNFKQINRVINYTPKKSNNGGKIRFDLTDPNVLVMIPENGERGFTDEMVGGRITVKGMYSITRDVIEPGPFPPPGFNAGSGPPDDFNVFGNAVQGVQTDIEEVVEQVRIPEQDDETNYRDEYSNVCFTGDTKVKLSNGRQVPIKYLRDGMKVKTEFGYAKILKVIKSQRPYGTELSKFKNLITTDNHPIKYRGQWYKAHEIGKMYRSQPLDVYNLILDKHHTIVANNVVSATLGKWESMNKFEMWREKQITMLRTIDEGEEGFGDSGSGTYSDNVNAGEDIPEGNFVNDNEVIVDRIVPSVTTKNLERAMAVSSVQPESEPIQLPADPQVEVPIDFEATITEVLDFNRIRVNLNYQGGANINKHTGEDNEREIFDDFMVHYTKSQIERLNTYLVVNGQYHLILNEKGSFATSNKRMFKLYEPIAEDVEEMDLCYFVEEKMDSYEDTINVVPFEEIEEEVLFLRLPDFNSTNNPINFRGTKFNNFNQLIGSDSKVQEDIQDKLISGSLLDTQVNVDYTKRTKTIGEDSDFGFGNFIHFGSAEKRINNFKKKLELIESYTASSQSYMSVTGSGKTVATFEAKRRRVINSFDPYEHFLYFESSSYATSSVGEFYSASWPKETSTKPYRLVHTTGSAATTWYGTWTGYGKTFDTANRERLVNNLPLHVSTDTQNNTFLDFMDMTGQQFDEIYVYLRHFTDMNERANKLSEGISKDIVREVAKTMGWSVVEGNDLMILPEYLLGKTPSGATKYETPQEQVTEEIWKRLLANLPFFMKTKGTQRAMKGLLNCYGIPSSILRVREYGGPDKGTRVNYEIKRKFTYALDFKSQQYVNVPWKSDGTSGIKPETVEFRFRSPKSKDQVILHKGTGNNSWGIQLQDNGATDAYGYLKFAISASAGVNYITSSLLPFYNDDMWSVMLTRKSQSGADLTADTATQKITYELTTKQYDASREVVLFADSQSMNVDGSTGANVYNTAFSTNGTIHIGGKESGGYTNLFSGSLMEFRLWSEPLSQSVFDNHTRAPKSYNGNTTESFFDNLIHRTQLNDNITLMSTSSFTDVSHTNSYNETGSMISGSGNLFRSIVDKEQLRVPNLGPSRRNATKIRLEGTSLTGPLSSNIRREQSSQDFAPIDSNKLGVYFSPADVVNEDIMYSIANFDFDDLVGDPRDVYEDSYRGLYHTQRKYWKKYSRTNNFWDYLRIIDYYDSGIWDQLRRLAPARANTTLGVLIEPNILERSKVIVGKPPEFENTYFENADHFGVGIDMTNFISGSDDRNLILSGNFPNYNGIINAHNTESGSLGTLGLPSLVHLGEINPRSEFTTTYATASITFGGTTTEFVETVQPFISSSRLSAHNEFKQKIYTSSLDAYTDTPFSSSFEPAEFESMATDSKLFRLFYKGQLLTKDNTIDGGDPVEITITSPTKLVTQEPGESKLKVE